MSATLFGVSTPAVAPPVLVTVAVGEDGLLLAEPGGLFEARALCLLLGPAVDEDASQ